MTQPIALRLAEMFDSLKLTVVGAQNALPMEEAAAELRRLHEVNQELVEALEGVTAHLFGAHELIQKGGKKAAPSNTMLAMILKDYEKSIEAGLAALAKARGTE